MLPLFSLISFFLLNGALGASAFVFALVIQNYKIGGRAKLFLSTFVFFVVQIVLMEMVLGIFDRLSYTNVTFLGYGLFLLATIIFYKNRSKIYIRKQREALPRAIVFLAIFTPLIFLLGVRAFNAILQIPFEYDSVAYHLPFVAEWLNTGSLRQLYYSAFAGPLAYYPSTYELLDLWVILPFRNDFFVNLINFPLFIVFGITVYKIFQNLRVSKNISLVAIALIISMPVFLRQAGVPLVDLFFYIVFCLSIFFLQEMRKAKLQGQSANGAILLFSLSLGLFIGTKFLGIVMAFPILILFIIFLLQYKKTVFSWAKECLLAIAGMGATGAFFYIRNWIDSGNPLFPIDVTIGGIKIFEGYAGGSVNDFVVSTSLAANITNMEKFKEFLFKFFLMTGWQSIAIVAVFVLTLFFVIYKGFIAKKKAAKEDVATGCIFLIGTLVYFALYFKSPYSYRDLIPNVRYGIPFLIIGLINMGFLVSRLKFLRTSFYLGSFLALTFSLLFLVFQPSSALAHKDDRLLLDFSIIGQHWSLFVLFTATLLAFFYFIQLIIQNRTKYKMISVAFVIAFLSLSFVTIQKSSREREKLIRYFSSSWYDKDPNLQDIMNAAWWFDENAPDAKIAYTGFNFHYHLYGRKLSREVDYVNINDCSYCRYVDYKDAPNSIRRDPNYQSWLTNLKKGKKNYLVIQPEMMKQVRNFEFEWAKAHTESFTEVFSQRGTHIYKIL